jgi:Leucine-rich repeat (LRR) protein
MVCQLPALRHLALGGHGCGAIAMCNNMSHLQQLRVLNLREVRVEALPAELGTWLPQLEELDVAYGASISSLPADLTRLTRLDASHTGITQVSAVTHLVTLKELVLEGSVLAPPLQPLTQLSALEAFTLGWASQQLPQEVAAQLHLPTPLPALRHLDVKGPLRLQQLQEVVVGAQQLTHLALRVDLEQEAVADLWQLGVLPLLEQLVLGWTFGDSGTTWTAAAPWLQQQPHLTSLRLDGVTEWALLQQLPAQLEELGLRWSTLPPPQPAALTQLGRLRKVFLDCHMLQPLPPWLASLSSLEEVDAGEGNVQEGWEVLGQLPLLRRVTSVVTGWVAPFFQNAPHLYWSLPGPAADA